MNQTLLIVSLLFATLGALYAAEAPTKKPNFVVIVADDHTYRAIGYNNAAVKTPNLDRLAAEGLRFDRAFVASPICAASRASLMSGVYPQQHGSVSLFRGGFLKSVVKEHRFATLPEVLGKAGYHSALYGKSHLGLGDPTTFGFAEGREIGDVNDDEIFAEADKFLQREAKTGRPFLLWLTPHNPHLPLTAPQRFKDLYKDADIQLDPNWRESPLLQSFFNQAGAGDIEFRDGKNLVYPRAPAGATGGPPRNESQMKEVIKAYYADISCLDDQIGRLVDQLKAAGLYENTYILYLADNGYHLGNHGLGNKITMHEESVRVPMLIHSPLLPVKHARSGALVSSLDVYPTLLELAGAQPQTPLMGKSLRPLLDKPSATVRDHVISECVGPPDRRLGTGHRMVRTEHLKYILSSSDDEAFFDLSSDPYEMTNLIADASQKDEIERHRKLLHEWSAGVGEKRLPVSEAKATTPAKGSSAKPKQTKKPKGPASSADDDK
jgi:arylsulfatase A-like enzyme